MAPARMRIVAARLAIRAKRSPFYTRGLIGSVAAASLALGQCRYDAAMRVLHIEAGRHIYGGAQQALWLASGLARIGVESRLLCPSNSEICRQAAVASVPMRGDADPLMVSRIATQIAAFGPDVVHVHSRRGADLWGGIAARLAGVPAVLTRRVESAEPRAWLRLKCRPYAAIVAISQAVDAQLADAGIEGRRRLRIASAVDTQRFSPRADARPRLRELLSAPPDAPVAAVVAQLIPRKGHASLLAALSELPARHAALRVVLFGQGPLRRALAAQIAAAGLADRVTLAGFRHDLDSLLPGADMLVHPATREGLGVAVLEAMAAGVPVVAAAVGGIVDVVRPGVDGWLVAPERPAALAAAVSAVLDDPSAARQRGAAGRQRVLRDFSIDAMTHRYLALYRQIAVADGALLGL